MIDLDEVLSAHVRDRLPVSPPPLRTLRRRAARRRLAIAGSGLAVVALAAGLSVTLAARAEAPDGHRLASDLLEPRQPSSPHLGVVAGRVIEVPQPEQRPVTLRFTEATGAEPTTFEVATRQGEAWTLELPAGSWRITAAEGGGVCQSTVRVTAGAWQRHDIAWPCEAGAAAEQGPPDGAPSVAGTIAAAVGERVRVTLDVRCGVGPISVDGDFFYADTYAAPGTEPPGWRRRTSGWATRIDGDTVRFLADDSTIRVTFNRDPQRQPPLCPA
jgi:hypothetical protein